MKTMLEYKTDGYRAFLIYCPGCKCSHRFPVEGPITWQWNESLDKPTFKPSMLVNSDLSNPTTPRCHSFITNGEWHFLKDCTHELAGQIVPLEELEEDKDFYRFGKEE